MNPIPVTDKMIELDGMAIITVVSNDFNIVVSIVYFSYFFLDLVFLYFNFVIVSLILLIELLKLFPSINFFPISVLNNQFSFPVVQMGKTLFFLFHSDGKKSNYFPKVSQIKQLNPFPK